MNVVVGVVRMTCWIQGLTRTALVEPTGTKGSAGRAGDGETGESIGYGELDAAHLYRGRKSAVAHPHLRNGEGRKGRKIGRAGTQKGSLAEVGGWIDLLRAIARLSAPDLRTGWKLVGQEWVLQGVKAGCGSRGLEVHAPPRV